MGWAAKKLIVVVARHEKVRPILSGIAAKIMCGSNGKFVSAGESCVPPGSGGNETGNVAKKGPEMR